MDAVRILNSYRTAIANDREAVAILALLYRSGPQTERQLADGTNLDIRRVQGKINELFRSRLACIVPIERWMTTDLANEVLARLGIAEAATVSLLSEQNISRLDLSFLSACTATRSSRDGAWPKYQTAFLRALKELKKDTLKDVGASRAELRRLLYGAVVGLDSDAQQLGGEGYVRYIIDWHSHQASELWGNWKVSWKKNEKLYAQYCNEAVELALDSNLCFASPLDAPRDRRPFRLAVLRIISTVGSEVSDSGIYAAARANRRFSSDVWISLGRAFPELETRAGNTLWLWGKARPSQGESWLQKLRSLLESALGKSTPNVGLLPASTEGFHMALTPLRGEWLEGTLLRFQSQIESGDYDTITREAKDFLLKLLDEARISFNERASSGLTSENSEAWPPSQSPPPAATGTRQGRRS